MAGLAAGAFLVASCEAGQAAGKGARVLVFTKTAGFRHDSIPAAIAALRELGATHGFEVVATEDAAAFEDSHLAQYRAVVWLLTTGDILDPAQQGAFERYVQGGGGYVGVHSAADTEYDWPFYGGLVGAYFKSHPPGTPTATIHVSDRRHPSTAPLPERWDRTDEWYNYQAAPAGNVHVLARLDERTYAGGEMGDNHPTAWCHHYSGGRGWYTGGGHTIDAYAEPLFRAHLLGGLQWAAGLSDGPCGDAPVSEPDKPRQGHRCGTSAAAFSTFALLSTLFLLRERRSPRGQGADSTNV